ncbi:MarR family winged helix-turn-helix transcriptional regulator [Sphingomonas gellani]|nr:MarR family transcriptional regulator [Sphingomonas gellani]
MTELILRIFRANGALLAAGDRLVGELDLTSARWQLLGGISEQDGPLTVSQLARNMGVTRQAVQRIANELEKDGVVGFSANPHHRRAQLIELTERGRDLFARAMDIQRPWAEALGRAVSSTQCAAAREALDTLLAALREMEATSSS